MKYKVLLPIFLAMVIQGCGEDKTDAGAELEKKAKLQIGINEIELKRRNAPDFKCGLPEIPGHTLGANPKCK